jgi:L-asparaginase
VCAIFLGGTIGYAGGGDPASPRRLSGDDVVAALAGAVGDLEVDVLDLMRKPSASVTLPDVELVLAAARDAPGDGVVVVQGTDTIEETSFLLDLLWDDARPIVVTGAMRKPVALGPDGAANLAAAIRVAAGREFRDQGALVVMNDEVHAARFVRKTHTSNVAAFRSPDVGPVGLVAEGVPRQTVRLAGERVVHSPTGPLDAVVPIVTAALGDGTETVSALAAVAQGMVVAAFGGGHVPAGMVPVLEELARRIPVVLSSRTAAGPVLTTTYSGPGSEVDLIERGLVPAGRLDPLKARLLLLVALACGAEGGDVDAMFREHGAQSMLAVR